MNSQANPNRQSLFQLLGSFLFTAMSISLVVLSLGTCSSATPQKDAEPDYPELFDHLKIYLNNYYWDLGRAQPRILFERALSALENAAEEIYVDNSDPDNPLVSIHVGDQSIIRSLNRVTTLDNALDYLGDIFDFLKRHYHGKTELNDIRYATANGFLTGLDPHTLVFSPKAFKEFYVHIEGEIYGVGMLVGVRDGKLSVIEVLKDTPAHRAGFRRGDTIVKIGEESTVNMSVNEAVQRIRGPRNSSIALTIKRKEPDTDTIATRTITVTRDRVVIKSVESKLLPGGLGYIQVNNFDKNTVASLKENIKRLHDENGGKDVSGLVFDLRNNSGGLLKEAADMADLFLESGTLYYIAGRNEVTSYEAEDDGIEPEFPMVVLCNEASASGAEIVIGALQKNHRAIVLGEPTFGKGSVQQLHPLKHDAQLKITVSEYLIPEKISIQENGVVPDFLAERVTFFKGAIDLFPDKVRGTERDYARHIVSKYAKEQTSLAAIQYPYIPPEEDPNAPDPFMTGDIKPLEDPLVQVAVRMLRMIESPREGGKPAGSWKTIRAEEFLQKNREGFEAIRKEQFQEIVKLLKEREIDWSEGDNPAEKPAASLEVAHEIQQRPSKDADDPYPKSFVVLKARLTNRSDRPIYRAAGISSADYFQYNEMEFLFGKVEPGQTVERSVEIQLRPSSASRIDNLSVAVTCPGIQEPIAQAAHKVMIEREEFPEFSCALTLKDFGGDDGAAAKKDSPIERLSPGTHARLTARIKNIGKRSLLKGIAILRNNPGQKEIFLETGRVEPSKELAPGETTDVDFTFRVQPDSKLESYKFDFGVFDSYYPSGLSHEFEIPGNPRDPGFPNGAWLEGPALVVRANVGGAEGAGEDTRSPLTTDQDSAALDVDIKDGSSRFRAWVMTSLVSLHVEDQADKIYYTESRDPGKPFDFKTRVPLHVGQNIITVIATNDQGLSQRKLLYIQRTPMDTALGKKPEPASSD